MTCEQCMETPNKKLKEINKQLKIKVKKLKEKLDFEIIKKHIIEN